MLAQIRKRGRSQCRPTGWSVRLPRLRRATTPDPHQMRVLQEARVATCRGLSRGAPCGRTSPRMRRSFRSRRSWLTQLWPRTIQSRSSRSRHFHTWSRSLLPNLSQTEARSTHRPEEPPLSFRSRGAPCGRSCRTTTGTAVRPPRDDEARRTPRAGRRRRSAGRGGSAGARAPQRGPQGSKGSPGPLAGGGLGAPRRAHSRRSPRRPRCRSWPASPSGGKSPRRCLRGRRGRARLGGTHRG
mmetsp:Transcript_113460/g.301507  ORF Transcript_113460/g.301507 Transcript_113460/m.301507 type:complete len:241 (+) Transcript_113460:824-1546(+)